MKTITANIKEGINQEIITEAGSILKDGGLVAFPTETVYGLGGNALDEQAAEKIYAAKGRPSDNPLIVHIAEFEALNKIAAEIPEEAKMLADAFWPGTAYDDFSKDGSGSDGDNRRIEYGRSAYAGSSGGTGIDTGSGRLYRSTECQHFWKAKSDLCGTCAGGSGRQDRDDP